MKPSTWAISEPAASMNAPTLFTIAADLSKMQVNASIDESDVGRIRPGQVVRFRVDAYPDREFTGKVSIIYPTLDERTRSLMVEARAANSQRLLKPGLFTKVILYTSEPKDTVIVPVTAILYEGKKLKVFLAEGDRARETIIQVGNKYDDVMEVTDGLKGGETLVVAGQQNLSEGAKLNVAR